MLPGYGRITQALLGTLLTWALTAAGACCVLFLRGNQRKSLDAALGFAAGVMVAASFWSLLNPAIEMAEDSGLYGSFAFVPVTLGFLIGALFVFGCDLLITKFGLNTFNIILQMSKKQHEEQQQQQEQAQHLRSKSVTPCSGKMETTTNTGNNEIHNIDDHRPIHLEMLPPSTTTTTATATTLNNNNNHKDRDLNDSESSMNDLSDCHLQISNLPRRIDSFSDCLMVSHETGDSKTTKEHNNNHHHHQRSSKTLINSLASEPRRRKNSTFEILQTPPQSTTNTNRGLLLQNSRGIVEQEMLVEAIPATEGLLAETTEDSNSNGSGAVSTNAASAAAVNTPCSASATTTVSAAIAEQWKRIILLVIAITVHNIPEGLAVGVSFGAIGSSNSSTFESARNLAIGIGIQNFPEGLAVSLPLRAAGFSMGRALWYGQLSGMVEPIFGVLGAVAVTMVSLVLPYALAFAAGAMIYIVIDDILPEANASGHGFIATWSAMTGFIVMMILDVALS